MFKIGDKVRVLTKHGYPQPEGRITVIETQREATFPQFVDDAVYTVKTGIYMFRLDWKYIERIDSND